MKKDIKKAVLSFAAAILIPLAIGGLSAFLTRGNMNIYEDINTPPLSPPSFLFPVVWTVLYILMGVSSGIVLLKRDEHKAQADTALLLYASSLVMNFIWSLIFFNFRAYLFSFIWLIAMFITIILTYLGYKRLSSLAAYLQIPYILWVSFAGYLNFGIWLLNK